MVCAMPFTTLVELYREAFRAHPKPNAFRRKVDGAWRDVSSAEAQDAIGRMERLLKRHHDKLSQGRRRGR